MSIDRVGCPQVVRVSLQDVVEGGQEVTVLGQALRYCRSRAGSAWLSAALKGRRTFLKKSPIMARVQASATMLRK